MSLIRVLIFVHLLVVCCSFQCKNEKNTFVDWYIIYKLPHVENDLKPLGSYIYITSENLSAGWTLAAVSINDSNSIPALTLQPLYKGTTRMHILYNDEPPSHNKNGYLGHTKGVVMSNDTHGFWIIHSVPHYPPTDTYHYPESALRYGQSLLCISFKLSSIDEIGKQLQYNQPFIYAAKIASPLTKLLPNIHAAIQNETVKSAPWFRLTTLNSTLNVSFLSFAKSGKFAKEMYKDWIAVTLKGNLLVESWLNGCGKLPSNCSDAYSVYNIKQIRLPYNVGFTSTHDHSKWMITEAPTTWRKWICIGDINREERQMYRGGGTVCMVNLELWKIYKSSVAEIEPCAKIRKP